MTTARNNNVTLFVTVLSACLGLLVAGAPVTVHGQQATTPAADEMLSGTDASGLSVVHVSQTRTQKHAAGQNAFFLTRDCRRPVAHGKILPHNPPPRTSPQRFLIVTRLPRAALPDKGRAVQLIAASLDGR